MDTLFIIGRVIFGLFFIYNGYGHFAKFKNMVGYAKFKKVPQPEMMVALSGAMLVLGGISYVLGIDTQVGTILLLAFMIPTTYMMHQFWNEKDAQAKMNETIGFTKNMAIIGALLMFLQLLVK
jgi:putative oxidoreductase